MEAPAIQIGNSLQLTHNGLGGAYARSLRGRRFSSSWLDLRASSSFVALLPCPDLALGSQSKRFRCSRMLRCYEHEGVWFEAHGPKARAGNAASVNQCNPELFSAPRRTRRAQ